LAVQEQLVRDMERKLKEIKSREESFRDISTYHTEAEPGTTLKKEEVRIEKKITDLGHPH